MFHKSALPGMASLVVTSAMASFLVWLMSGVFLPLLMSFILLVGVFYLWFQVLVHEGLGGYHTDSVVGLLRSGFLWFVFSEVTFFFGIFWFLFDSALSPSIELGAVWVPVGVTPINPFGLPLLNSAVLLSSAVTLTWAHHSMMSGSDPKPGLVITLFLGVYFLAFQLSEYSESSFTLSGSSFGSIFYLSTGFHGTHVLLGILFLYIAFLRLKASHFSSSHHEGFQFAILYWHFVDVVWLGLYIVLYWWGS